MSKGHIFPFATRDFDLDLESLAKHMCMQNENQKNI